MSYEFYKILHLLALAAMFASVGASAIAPDTDRKIVGMTHGIALLVVLVSGFGMHAKLGIQGFPGWLIAKVVIWLVFGGLLAVGRRAPGAKLAVWGSIPVLTAVAAWLVIARPF